VGVGLRNDPAFTPILPLRAGEGGDVGARHPVPKLEVVRADLAPAPPGPNQGIEMPEDGGAGAHPHEHLHEMDEDRHEKDGVGGEMVKLEAELLQEQKEEGEERRDQPAHGVRVEENELPRGKVAEGDLAGPDLLGVCRRGPSHQAATRSSWAWVWKRRGKGREDMAMAVRSLRMDRKGAGKRRKPSARKLIVGKVVKTKGRYSIC
jgi:hypothetical protein